MCSEVSVEPMICGPFAYICIYIYICIYTLYITLCNPFYCLNVECYIGAPSYPYHLGIAMLRCFSGSLRCGLLNVDES